MENIYSNLSNINLSFISIPIPQSLLTLHQTSGIKRAVVTACNSRYFRSCLTLITSLYKHSNTIIDKIYVFDLGLNDDEIGFLQRLSKVECITMDEILNYTHDIRTIFPDFLTPNQFAWKPYFIKHVFDFFKVQNVMWIDSGIVTFGSLKCVFKHIEKEGVWLTEETDWINYNWTHPQCINIMNATPTELQANQLIAGLTGFNINNEEAMEVLNEWYTYSTIKECVTGDHYISISPSNNPLLKGHRHDQSILAILRVRYNLPTVLKSPDLFEWRSLQDAIQNNSLFYCHHGNYIDIDLK